MSNHAPKVDPASWLLFLASAVAILLAVYVLVSSLINTIKKNSTKGEIDSTSLVAAASDNLKPVGTSSTSDAPVVAASTSARSGKEVYAAVCQACHATGVAESPKFGDKAAWEPRVATGLDAMLTVAINGKGAMPARGGNPAVTDDELKAAILYMTKEAGFDLGGDEKPVAEAPAKEEAAPVEAAPEVKEVEVKAEEKAVAAETTPVKEEVAKVEEAPAAEEVATKEEPVAPAAPKEPEAPAIVEEQPQEEAPVAEAPVVATTTAVAEKAEVAPAAVDLEKGKAVYSRTCFACHATGVAGSPKLDDKAAWAPRIATGMDALYNTSLKGKGAMPPKGGNVSLPDEDVKAAVDYMVSVAK